MQGLLCPLLSSCRTTWHPAPPQIRQCFFVRQCHCTRTSVTQQHYNIAQLTFTFDIKDSPNPRKSPSRDHTTNLLSTSSQLNPIDYQQVNPKQSKKFNRLPRTSTGCGSAAAVAGTQRRWWTPATAVATNGVTSAVLPGSRVLEPDRRLQKKLEQGCVREDKKCVGVKPDR